MPLTKNTGHILDALKKLAAPFWGKPRVASMVWAFTKQVQELEDAAFDIIAARTLDGATGVHLAMLGRIVGQANTGDWDDDTYRLYIRARIVINRSEGTRKDLLRLLRALGVRGRVRPAYPAGNRVDLLDNPEISPIVAELLAETASAGVSVFVVSGVAEDEAFMYGYANGSSVVGGTLYGQDSDSSLGAKYTYVIAV